MGDPLQRLQTENLEIGKTKEGRQRLLRLQVSDTALYPKLREMFALTGNEASKAVATFTVLNFRKCCGYFADFSKNFVLQARALELAEA